MKRIICILFTFLIKYIILKELDLVTQLHFHQMKDDIIDDEIPILLDDCMDNPIFSPDNKTPIPSIYTPSSDLKIKINGIMTKEQKIKSLYIEVKNSNTIISNETIDYKGQLVPEGSYSFTYSTKLPTKPLTGLNQIFIYLINTNDERISCTRTFYEIK